MKFVRVIEPVNQGELAVIKSLLDGNGINYYVQNEHLSGLYNIPVLPCVVMVDEWDVKKAETLLSLLQARHIRKVAG